MGFNFSHATLGWKWAGRGSQLRPNAVRPPIPTANDIVMACRRRFLPWPKEPRRPKPVQTQVHQITHDRPLDPAGNPAFCRRPTSHKKVPSSTVESPPARKPLGLNSLVGAMKFGRCVIEQTRERSNGPDVIHHRIYLLGFRGCRIHGGTPCCPAFPPRPVSAAAASRTIFPGGRRCVRSPPLASKPLLISLPNPLAAPRDENRFPPPTRRCEICPSPSPLCPSHGMSDCSQKPKTAIMIM